MKHAHRLLAAAVLGASLSHATLDTQRVQLIGKTDRDPVTYAVGDTMTFTITADTDGQTPGNEYSISWTRTGDDGKTEKGTAKPADGPATITTSLDRPGFVRIQAKLTGADGKPLKKTIKRWGRDHQADIAFDGGAGAAVGEIRQAVAEPEDFDAFWQRQKDRLAQVPAKCKMEELEPRSGTDVFAVTIDCAGPRPVTGYLTIPRDAADKSLPARVSFQGYGVSKQGLPGGNKYEIHFHVNAHGYELGRDNDYYKEFAAAIKSNGHGYAFDPEQNADPENAYFNGMALRVMRALEFVKQRPQWNGKGLIVNGGSQGGLQSIWAAALDPAVTRCDNDITWCCNLAGHAVDNRLNGWYPKWIPALGYYDAVNHAKRIKCPVTIPRAGLGDYTCPPSGLAVLYNTLACPKKITWVQGSDHGYVPPNAEKFTQESK